MIVDSYAYENKSRRGEIASWLQNNSMADNGVEYADSVYTSSLACVQAAAGVLVRPTHAMVKEAMMEVIRPEYHRIEEHINRLHRYRRHMCGRDCDGVWVDLREPERVLWHLHSELAEGGHSVLWDMARERIKYLETENTRLQLAAFLGWFDWPAVLMELVADYMAVPWSLKNPSQLLLLCDMTKCSYSA